MGDAQKENLNKAQKRVNSLLGKVKPMKSCAIDDDENVIVIMYDKPLSKIDLVQIKKQASPFSIKLFMVN